jgi:hypothetical protein
MYLINHDVCKVSTFNLATITTSHRPGSNMWFTEKYQYMSKTVFMNDY